jgi:hypothetical protein
MRQCSATRWWRWVAGAVLRVRREGRGGQCSVSHTASAGRVKHACHLTSPAAVQPSTPCHSTPLSLHCTAAVLHKLGAVPAARPAAAAAGHPLPEPPQRCRGCQPQRTAAAAAAAVGQRIGRRRVWRAATRLTRIRTSSQRRWQLGGSCDQQHGCQQRIAGGDCRGGAAGARVRQPVPATHQLAPPQAGELESAVATQCWLVWAAPRRREGGRHCPAAALCSGCGLLLHSAACSW